MVKYLIFKTSNGDRVLNANACDLVVLFDVNTIHASSVPYVTASEEWNIQRDGVNGIDFDGALVDIINDAIIRAEQTSYTEVFIDVPIPSKYAIGDIVSA